MYQSLYRVYRPRTFSEMSGQETVVRTLRNQAAQGRFAHAYLFSGSRGTGKTSAARIMAAAINCEQPKNGDPCLVCASCRQLALESTLDIYEMDAASNSRVEEIREMLEKVGYPPQFLKYKVYIIDEAHMLSTAAFNALLKTLEEPPSYMVFILATTEPQKIPATIQSRCQRFDFGRLTEEAIVSRLRHALVGGIRAEDEALHLIAAYAEGSMRDAWSMMDVCLGMGDHLTADAAREALGAPERPFLFSYLDAAAAGDVAEVLRLTDELLRAGKDAQVFLRDLSSHLRRLISVACGAGPGRESTREAQERLERQVRAVPLPFLVDLLEKCSRAESEFRWASSQRAALELFALRASRAGEAPLPAAPQAERVTPGGQTPIKTSAPRPETRAPALPKAAAEPEPAIPADEPGPQPQQAAAEPEAPEPALPTDEPESPPQTAADMAKPEPAAPAEEPKEHKPAMQTDEPESLPQTAADMAKPEPALITDEPEPPPRTAAVPVASEPVQPSEEPLPPPQAPADTAEPAPEPPQAAPAAGKALPRDAWNDMLKKVRDQPLIHALLAQGRFGGYKDGVFKLVFAPDGAATASILQAEDKLALVGGFLSQAMGGPVALAVVVEDGAAAREEHRQLAERDIRDLSSVFGRDNVVVHESRMPRSR